MPAAHPKILILNGPNLNLLGVREPDVYGTESMMVFTEKLQSAYPHVSLEVFQSNHEGELIEKLHRYHLYNGLIINAGALSHYSYSLYDALKLIPIPKVEVHITNIFAREAFRRESVLSPVCDGVITGLGMRGYALALSWLLEYED